MNHTLVTEQIQLTDSQSDPINFRKKVVLNASMRHVNWERSNSCK